jgi:hypothetical protein
VNLIDGQASEARYEMLRVFVPHFPGPAYGVAPPVIGRHFLPLSDACPDASQICKSVLFGMGTPD